MKNENRAVFDRASERCDYAFELRLTDPTPIDESGHGTATLAVPHSTLRRAALFILRKLHQRRNRNALLELSDDQLKDIGVSRSQAYADQDRYRRDTAHGIERKCL